MSLLPLVVGQIALAVMRSREKDEGKDRVQGVKGSRGQG
jgi:hypothetical protein